MITSVIMMAARHRSVIAAAGFFLLFSVEQRVRAAVLQTETRRVNSSVVLLNFYTHFLERDGVLFRIGDARHLEAAVCRVQGARGSTGEHQQLVACSQLTCCHGDERTCMSVSSQDTCGQRPEAQ